MFEGISFISLVCIIITSILLGINVPKLRDIKKRNNDKLIITHEYVINRIEYPTNIPNINNFDDYTECNCGEHCISNYGICNKIYINDNNTEYLVHNTIDDYNSICTIINKNCVDNINILDKDKAKEIEKRILLQCIDLNWKSHIQYLEQLRQVIGLRSYGQRDPLVEYKKEAFNLFENLLNKLKVDLVTLLINLKNTQKALIKPRYII